VIKLSGEFKFPTIGKGLLFKASGAFLIGITIGIIFLNVAWFPSPPPIFNAPEGQRLLKFTSYDELKAFLNQSPGGEVYRFYGEGAKGALPAPAADYQAGGTKYSQTNIQVAGVDETDLVKSDGEYIYLGSDGKVLIVKAYPPETADIVSEISVNGTVIGIFVNENRLTIFVSKVPQYYYFEREAKPGFAPTFGGPQTSIEVYDMTDKTNAFLARNVTIDGSYMNSRMIGDYVYVLLNSPAYVTEAQEIYLPSITDKGEAEPVEATSIYYSNVTDYSYSLTMIMSLNVKDDQEPTNLQNFLIGYAGAMYVSSDNIFIAIPKYVPDGTEITEIHKISINQGDITYVANGAVPGYVLNQFSMDEYNGYFRIATTLNSFAPRPLIDFATSDGKGDNSTNSTSPVPTPIQELAETNNVYVMNQTMGIVGRLEKLAPGEKIYSARFMGDRCYLVTFVQVDPLFVISLADPTNPKVLGELKIPGYSSYLHPYDENRLIGIGKSAVGAKDANFAWYQGVKISLFDVSDLANPREAANFIIGDRGTDSPVLYDHKAFLFDNELGLLAIPVLVAEIDESQYPDGVPDEAYGVPVWQGLYVFDITANSITLRGNVTHIDTFSDTPKDYYYMDWNYQIQRSLYIENALYTISPRMIKINDLTTLKEINKIELPYQNSYGNIEPSPEPGTSEPSNPGESLPPKIP